MWAFEIAWKKEISIVTHFINFTGSFLAIQNWVFLKIIQCLNHYSKVFFRQSSSWHSICCIDWDWCWNVHMWIQINICALYCKTGLACCSVNMPDYCLLNLIYNDRWLLIILAFSPLAPFQCRPVYHRSRISHVIFSWSEKLPWDAS